MPIVKKQLDTNLELLRRVIPPEASMDEIVTLFYTILAVYNVSQEGAFQTFTSAIVNIPETYDDFYDTISYLISQIDGEPVQ